MNSLNEIINKKYQYGMLIEYNFNKNSILNSLCDKYGTDKGGLPTFNNPYSWPSHTYADFYEMLFGSKRKSINKVFECGLGTNNISVPSNMSSTGIPGASLRVWKDYFPNAQIIGIDVDKGILFNEDRISTFQCDQTSKSSIQNFISKAKIKPEELDIIFDDGLHKFHAGISLFEGMIPFLHKEGTYIIEDILEKDLELYIQYFRSKAGRKYHIKVVHLHRPKLNINSNRLIVINKLIN